MVQYPALRGFYDIGKTIGCGGFAKVKLATHIATGEKVAIKIMEKSCLGVDLPRVKLELMALKVLSHRHICKLYQVLETDTHYFLVVEYCSGGELFDHIVERNKLSETQSRKFFRQIVSAVAYMHSVGYAHRDLKPENVLLDNEQYLKLIDFGLCAKPDGGIKSPLSTSCGSPTYAAPELVLGRDYLGPEVDVWSMGVLLYALLCGFLPFDDLSINNLYKKILSGKYHVPPFLSKASKDFISLMLQVDPEKRITIKAMLNHPWITAGGILEPVEFKSEKGRCYDEKCISVMAQYYGTTVENMRHHVKYDDYNYITATYLLLYHRKVRGLSLKLNSSAFGLPIIRIEMLNQVGTNGTLKLIPQEVNQPKIAIRRITEKQKNDKSEKKLETNAVAKCSPGGPFIEPGKLSGTRKPQKRFRSPTLDNENSPVPAKKATTPDRSTFCTPERRKGMATPVRAMDTPGRKVLGSIERSLNRVRHVLSSRKSNSTDQPIHPIVLTNKDLCNVSTTQCRDPEFVIMQLARALEKKGIQCIRKGFSLRGKMEPSLSYRLGGCSFELEICYLPSILAPSAKNNDVNGQCTPTISRVQKNLATPIKSPTIFQFPTVILPSAKVGIRRKRLKGDSWCYKKVCEEVLALTAVDFKQFTESAV